MEPVDPVADFLTTRGTLLKGVTLAVYDPKLDVDAGNPWGVPVKIRGSRGAKVTQEQHGTGDIATTTTTWTITSLTPDVQLSRPTLRSKIKAQGETWLILSVEPDPILERLFECETVLIPGG
jgi:hypothetical protein